MFNSRALFAAVCFLSVPAAESFGQLDLSDPIPLLGGVNNAAAIWSPTVTPDGLELYYTHWYNDKEWDIHSASRESVEHRWHANGAVPSLESAKRDGKATFSPDGLTMIFGSQRGTVNDWDLWRTFRSDLDSPWGEPEPYEEFVTPQNFGAPAMTSDGLTLYLGNGWPFSGPLWQVSRDSIESPWSEPDIIPGFEGKDGNYPAISHDQLTMVYAVGGGSQDDLWMAVRDSVDQPFETHTELVEFNTQNVDGFPFLDSDGSLYFVQDSIPGGSGWNIHKTGTVLLSPFGDTNLDSTVDVLDIDRVCTVLGRGRFVENSALNGGGVVGVTDVAELTEAMGVVAGDADANGTVDFSDFLTLSHNFGDTQFRWSHGDFDCDGAVEFADFLALSSNFGETTASEMSTQSVPEPNTLGLSLLCIVGCLMIRRPSS